MHSLTLTSDPNRPNLSPKSNPNSNPNLKIMSEPSNNLLKLRGPTTLSKNTHTPNSFIGGVPVCIYDSSSVRPEESVMTDFRLE